MRPDVEPKMVKPVGRRGRPAKMRPDVEPKMVKPVGRRGRPAKIRPQEPMASILSKFNLADLNDYEKELFDEIKKNSPNLSKEVILSILISDAEGDLTQLSQGLANAARQMSQPAARRGRPAKIVKKAEPETPAPAARRGRPAKIVKQGQKELSPKSLMPLVEALITFKEQLGLGELTMQEMMDVVKLLDSNKILKYSKGGKISKNATYIPRQEIEKILLTSGVEITNDGTILSGVWKKNMKKENGGQVEIADFDDVDLEGEDYGHFVISGESAALYDGVEEFIVDDNGIYLGKMVGDNFYIILDDGTQTLAEESEWEIAYMDGGKTAANADNAVFSVSKTYWDINGKPMEIVIAENMTAMEFLDKYDGYEDFDDEDTPYYMMQKKAGSLAGFYFELGNGDTIQSVPSYHKRGEILRMNSADTNKTPDNLVFSLSYLFGGRNEDPIEVVVDENVTIEDFADMFENGYYKRRDTSSFGFHFEEPNGSSYQLVPSFHKKGEIL
jgi:hypothetical protein